MTQMNVAQLALRLEDEIPAIGPKDARKRISRAIQANQSAHSWSFLLKRTSIQTEALYNTGTVAVTNGLTAVVLTSGTWVTSWSTAPSSRKIVIQGRPEPYDITITGATTGTLSEAWIGDTDADATYTLFRDTYPLPVDCDYGKLLVMWDRELNRRMDFYDFMKFAQRKFLANGTTGTPTEIAYVGFTSETAPRPQIEFGFEAPADVQSYHLWYFQRPAFPTQGTDVPLFPQPYEDLHWLKAAIEYGKSPRTPQKFVPVWQRDYDALFFKAKQVLDGGAEIDRQVESVFLGQRSGGTSGAMNPDFANNWRYNG